MEVNVSPHAARDGVGSMGSAWMGLTIRMIRNKMIVFMGVSGDVIVLPMVV